MLREKTRKKGNALRLIVHYLHRITEEFELLLKSCFDYVQSHARILTLIAKIIYIQIYFHFRHAVLRIV